MRKALKELHCPHCGYDLRGQTIERCPECGNEYDADDIEQERRGQWEDALAPFHTALPLLAGAALALIALVLIPDPLTTRAGLLPMCLLWIVGKVLSHLLRGLIMGDVLGEFHTGAGLSFLGWFVDVFGTFPWWTDVALALVLLARYAGWPWDRFAAYGLAATGCAFVAWGILQNRGLKERGQFSAIGDVERRMLWRAQWTALALLPVLVWFAVMAAF